MQFFDALSIIRRSWLYLVVGLLAGLGVSSALSLSQVPLFQSTSTIFVSTTSATTATDLSQGSSFTQNIVKSYAEVATSDLVLARVKKQLSLQESTMLLARRISATTSLDTVIITIAVEDASPSRAAAIANSVAQQTTYVVQRISPDLTGSRSAVTLTQLSSARPAGAPSSPKYALNLLVGVILGLLGGIAVALMRSALDTRIRRVSDAERNTGLALLGEIPFIKDAKPSALIHSGGGSSPLGEQFKRLRTNLKYLNLPHRPVLLITSTEQGEGKSTSVINLAVEHAALGLSVLIVDADLRRPQIADYVGLDGSVGLVDVLVGDVALADAVQSWADGSVSCLPAGHVPPNASEMIQSEAMRSLLGELQNTYDLVLVDAPPVLAVSDATALAEYVDGVLFVCGLRRTRAPLVQAAMRELRATGVKLLGVAATMVPSNERSGYSYGYRGYDLASDLPQAN